MGVQTLRPEPAVERFDISVIRHDVGGASFPREAQVDMLR
jgi:hypothetical protein